MSSCNHPVCDSGGRRIYDVTCPISETLPVWPGDPRVRFERARDVVDGNPVHTTRLELGSHTGTHVDAPRHMLDDGATVDQIPLSRFLGPARVVEVDAPVIRGQELTTVDLEGTVKVLFKTRNSGKLARPEFETDYVALDPSGARYLVDRGVDLVGIDYLSIETYSSTSFETHHVLMRAGVVIIEGLYLAEVPAADYELLCFPMLLESGDGAPARVALREL